MFFISLRIRCTVFLKQKVEGSTGSWICALQVFQRIIVEDKD